MGKKEIGIFLLITFSLAGYGAPTCLPSTTAGPTPACLPTASTPIAPLPGLVGYELIDLRQCCGSQSYVSNEIICQKLCNGPTEISICRVTVKPTGQIFLLVEDGHHSASACVIRGTPLRRCIVWNEVWNQPPVPGFRPDGSWPTQVPSFPHGLGPSVPKPGGIACLYDPRGGPRPQVAPGPLVSQPTNCPSGQNCTPKTYPTGSVIPGLILGLPFLAMDVQAAINYEPCPRPPEILDGGGRCSMLACILGNGAFSGDFTPPGTSVGTRPGTVVCNNPRCTCGHPDLPTGLVNTTLECGLYRPPNGLHQPIPRGGGGSNASCLPALRCLPSWPNTSSCPTSVVSQYLYDHDQW